MKSKWITVALFLLSIMAALGATSGSWLEKVPAHERQKSNPFRDQPDAAEAGRHLFSNHCATCHGTNAEGKKKKPSLRSARIQSEATEGDLHWLLVNGDLRHGMPSWSKLPDPQLWQLVSFLKSLKPID